MKALTASTIKVFESPTKGFVRLAIYTTDGDLADSYDVPEHDFSLVAQSTGGPNATTNKTTTVIQRKENQDSISVGNSKTGVVKVYVNSDDLEGSKRKINNAMLILAYAKDGLRKAVDDDSLFRGGSMKTK